MWSSDLDGMAAITKARHADMLNAAIQRQQLKQLLPKLEHKHNLWQWVGQAIDRNLLHGHSLRLPLRHHTVQHG